MNLGLGSIGNVGNLIGGVVAVGITAIVLLTFAPTITGDLDAIFLQTKEACVVDGERFTQIVAAGTGTADDAWMKSGGGAVTAVTEAGCEGAKAGTVPFYTPKGTQITGAAAATTLGGTWMAPSTALNALGGGTLIQLLFGAMGILVPAGAIGFLAYSGAMLVRDRVGGGTLAVAIGTTITVVVIGAILPEIFTPLDRLFNVMDGYRFEIFATGIGKLAGVLGNFLGISLVAGIIALGGMLWQNSHGGGSKSGSYGSM